MKKIHYTFVMLLIVSVMLNQGYAQKYQSKENSGKIRLQEGDKGLFGSIKSNDSEVSVRTNAFDGKRFNLRIDQSSNAHITNVNLPDKPRQNSIQFLNTEVNYELYSDTLRLALTTKDKSIFIYKLETKELIELTSTCSFKLYSSDKNNKQASFILNGSGLHTLPFESSVNVIYKKQHKQKDLALISYFVVTDKNGNDYYFKEGNYLIFGANSIHH